MSTDNRDIQDHLSNGKTGNIGHVEFARDSVYKLYIKFSNQHAGLKALKSSYLGRQNSWVPIEKWDPEIPVKKGSASPSIESTQFSLTLALTSTVHKVQYIWYLVG